ncbi:MAG: response regulator [Limisphaerales bacterium]
MISPITKPNRRILVVDDNAAIHADFRKILGAPEAADAELDAAESKLFGRQQAVAFEIDTASQGAEGLKMVERSLAEGRPYAMAFMDFRMPPGWDGIETTKRIWQVCPDLQIVICTAFADCSWDEVLEELNPLDRLLILKKPFDSIEVLQLASALTEKWRLRQESKAQLGSLEQVVRHRTRELEESQNAALNMMEDAVRHREKTERALEDLKHEVSERKKTESHLLQAQKMEAIGQLAGGIAHDFNNIIGAILGNVDLARMIPVGDPGREECLDAIHGASRRAADLVKQILAFSRRQEVKRQPMELRVIVREVLKLLRATIPAAVVFEADLAATPTVLADPSEIHQVAMNLCTNAWHALKGGAGVIRVTLAEIEVDAELARLHPDLRPGAYVRLTVQDTGCGMDAATLARIFDPFFTTKPAGEGTGLGLAVVHGIVKNHDGGIVVESQPGVGTTFQLYFPVFASAVAETAAPPLALPQGNGAHILFVDDEEPMIRMGRLALERMGYQVTTTINPTEALAWSRQQPDRFDLVVTDFNMPGLNGAELARQLRETRPGLRLILTTGYSASMDSAAARQSGFSELLPKPYDLRTLGEAVQRVLNPATPEKP